MYRGYTGAYGYAPPLYRSVPITNYYGTTLPYTNTTSYLPQMTSTYTPYVPSVPSYNYSYVP